MLLVGAEPVTSDTEKRHAESPDQRTQSLILFLRKHLTLTVVDHIEHRIDRSKRSASLQKGAK